MGTELAPMNKVLYPPKKTTILIEDPLELSNEYPFTRKKTMWIQPCNKKIFYGEEKLKEM